MNIGRLVVLVIFAASLAAFLSGCGGAHDPVGTVKAFNKTSAKGKFEKAQKYIAQEKRAVDSKSFNVIRDIMKDLPSGTKETVDNILHDMTYELVSQEGNTAIVRATIDISSMLKEYTGTTESPLMGITKMSVNYILEKRDMKWQIVDVKPAMGM
jgi:hypothetical protein